MSQTDIAELRRMWDERPEVEWNVADEMLAKMATLYNALPALLDELEAAREEVRRLTQANADLRKERDRAVAEAQRQDGVAKGLRRELEAAREALSQIYWKSLELGEDRGDSTVNHIAADALKGETSPLHARDRRQKLIGAAEELERLADSTNELREMYLTEEFYGLRAFSPMLLSNSMKERAAQLRQEAEEK